MTKTLGRPETFFKQNFKKGNAMLLVTGFATVSQITNNCQLSCGITKFCYTWVNKCDVTRSRHQYMIRGNTSDFIGHPLPKDYISDLHMGPPTTPGPHHLNPALSPVHSVKSLKW